MSYFHATQITVPMEVDRVAFPVQVAGHSFPDTGTDEEKVGHLEEAVASLSVAVTRLSGHVERLEREIRKSI
jgi:hypothetical protein